MLVRDEDVEARAAELRRALVDEPPLRRREQRPGEVDLHAQLELDRLGAGDDLGGLARVQQRRAHDQLRAREVVELGRHGADVACPSAYAAAFRPIARYESSE